MGFRVSRFGDLSAEGRLFRAEGLGLTGAQERMSRERRNESDLGFKAFVHSPI